MKIKSPSFLWILSVFISLWFVSPAQIDPHKRDSLQHAIDSSARVMRAWQDRFRYHQDSMYQQQTEIKIVPAERMPVEKAVAKKEKDLPYTGILIGIAFLIVLILFLRSQSRKASG